MHFATVQQDYLRLAIILQLCYFMLKLLCEQDGQIQYVLLKIMMIVPSLKPVVQVTPLSDIQIEVHKYGHPSKSQNA